MPGGWRRTGGQGAVGGEDKGIAEGGYQGGGMGYLSLCRRVPRAAGDSHVPRVEPGWGGGNRFFPRAALHHDEWRVAGPWGLHELCLAGGASGQLRGTCLRPGSPRPLTAWGASCRVQRRPADRRGRATSPVGSFLMPATPNDDAVGPEGFPPRVSCPSRVDPTSRASFGGTEASSPLERLPALGLRCQ